MTYLKFLVIFIFAIECQGMIWHKKSTKINKKFIWNFFLAGHYQRLLLEKLFRDYDPTERPVFDENESLNVSVGLAIQQIVDVDEKKQTIVFSGWLDMTWTDYNLRWNPIEFGNITKIRIQSSKVWIPGIFFPS